MRVPLVLVASVEVASGPAQISRERLQRRISVPASVRGRDVRSVGDASNAAVDRQVMPPPYYSLVWSGRFQNLQETTAHLSVVMPAALAGILGLFVVMFGDIRLAGLILLDVPMAATGGSWRLPCAACRSRSRRRTALTAFVATVVIGGLISAILLTLVVLPTVYP